MDPDQLPVVYNTRTGIKKSMIDRFVRVPDGYMDT